MKTEAISPHQDTALSSPKTLWSWLALVLSALFLLIASGRHTVPIAAWMSLLFMLRFVRTQPKKIGLPIAWLVLFLTWAFQLRGQAPLPGIAYYYLSGSYGLILLLPFLADRLTFERTRGIASTLIFPCAWVTMEWLVASYTPYSSWGAMAYTQHENLVLLQLVSVTGLYGVGFLIAWFGAVGNLIWQTANGDRTSQRAALVFGSVMVLVLLGGGIRLVLFAPDAPTVRIASLTETDYDPFAGTGGSAADVFTTDIPAEEIAVYRANSLAVIDDLLVRAEREVQAGAQIIFWGEANGFCLKEHEPEIIALGVQFAQKHGVYLGMSPAVIDQSADKPFENKIILIDPQGEVSYEYWKARPVPGGEAAIQAVDDGLIKSVPSEHGRLGSAICFDMDFPGLLQQAGRQNVDIMLVPSNDWPEIDPWHSHMARLRAIEQGFNLVRHVSKGFSIATDYQGRVLASMDHYVTEERNLVSHVPTRGVTTIYAKVGDFFTWLCIAGLLGLVIRSRFGAGPG